MVNSVYLVGSPGSPSRPKRYLDQTLVPAAIDAAAHVEAALEQVARPVRRKPLSALGAALGAGFLVARHFR